MKSLLEYFYKIKHSNSNSNLVSTIISYYQFEIVFYYYQDFLFDVSISFKLEWFQKDNIKRKEKLINLEAPLNSSILSKTLEEGSQIKKLIFSNSKSFYPLYNPAIHISFSGNTLTIDCYEMNPNYLKLLLELWPGLILRLEYIKKYNDCCDLDLIQAFLSYCGRSPPCCRLSFSKVIIEINIYYIRHSIFIESYENVSKLKHLIDSLSKIYDVELKNISYEDLFINRTDYFKQYIGRKRDEYNNEKLKFECIKCYLDGFYRNTNDGFNQTIEELKLKEFEFYADKIHMNRNTYDNLKRAYQFFGQFQYSFQGDCGQIHTYVAEYDRYLDFEITSKIEENNISLFRSITVDPKGIIEEQEYSSNSEFHRFRVIYMDGLCEEYSIHDDTGFGIRKVVYPDGQQFTNEVYGYRGYNAVGEETYAIQSKSISYLLGKQRKTNKYKYITEDGSFNFIYSSENMRMFLTPSELSELSDPSEASDCD